MYDQFATYFQRYDDLNAELTKPDVFADKQKYKKLIKEFNNLQPIVEMCKSILKVQNDKELAQSMLEGETDNEMRILLNQEVLECSDKFNALNDELKKMLLPKDENDEKNIIMEIRGGAGGDEASLFAAELYRMYGYYAATQRWKLETLSLSESEVGGLKDVSFLIKGTNVYGKLKYESGVHRVQRVPETESQGRIHTSTCTVAVLPEQEDVDIEINDNDLKIDTYRSGGHGGQSVNTTDSAIRITHLPTGLVVACQDERSQMKNRERAYSILKSKLYDYYKSQSDQEYAENRRTQIGNGDRSERIRTYNYPQDRLTDHRINYTVYNLQGFLNGDLEELLTELKLADEKAKLVKANLS